MNHNEELGFESHNGKLKTSSLRVYHIVQFYNFLGDETNSQNVVDRELSFKVYIGLPGGNELNK